MKKLITGSFFLVIILICASMLMTGCGSKTTTTSAASISSTTPSSGVTTSTTQSTTPVPGTPKRGGTMRVAGPPDPGGPFGWPADAIGPATASAQPALETLYRQLADGSYIPWLATSYEVATDGKSITFRLRKGVKFHDDTDFNAQAVKFNFDALIEAQMQPFWVSTEVIDDYTLKLNVTNFNNMIIGTFADSSYIASPTYYEKYGKEAADYHPVGTGPFEFVSYEPNVKVSYKRFNDYWQPGKPYLDAIEIHYITDPQTLMAAMQTGQLDMTNISLGQQQLDFQNAGFTVSVNPMTTYVLVFDTVNPDSPFSKLEVRQAVEYAIDREGIAKGIGKGTWVAPYQVPAPSNGAYDPNFKGGLKYNPEKARELLEKAGYPDGFDTAIISQPAARQSDVEVAIQANLNAVGIRTEIKDVDQGTFANYQSNGWHNAMMISPIAAFGNFNSSLQFYFGENQLQFKSWELTSEYLNLLNASLNSPTYDISLVRAVTDYMVANSLVIPVSQSGLGFAYSSYVKDGGFNERGFPTNWNMDSVWLDK